MGDEWLAALSFTLLCVGLAASVVVAARLLRVRARASSPLKRLTYECGEEPQGLAWVRFHPRYYVVALFFVLFDVEAVFLFPWAVTIRAQGSAAIVEMLVFVAILMLGWGYAAGKGALKWH